MFVKLEKDSTFGDGVMVLEPANNRDREELRKLEREVLVTDYEADEKGIRKLFIPIRLKK